MRPGFCVKCAADVSALPQAARFCYRCGSRLTDSRSPDPLLPPQILIAYARALLNLGWRYETAIGSQRNLDEAARCYEKAGRLVPPTLPSFP